MISIDTAPHCARQEYNNADEMRGPINFIAHVYPEPCTYFVVHHRDHTMATKERNQVWHRLRYMCLHTQRVQAAIKCQYIRLKYANERARAWKPLLNCIHRFCALLFCSRYAAKWSTTSARCSYRSRMSGVLPVLQTNLADAEQAEEQAQYSNKP